MRLIRRKTHPRLNHETFRIYSADARRRQDRTEAPDVDRNLAGLRRARAALRPGSARSA